MITIKGAMVVQWLALLPHRKKVMGSKDRGFYLWLRWLPLRAQRPAFGDRWFSDWIDVSFECEWLFLYVCSPMSWLFVQDVIRLLPEDSCDQFSRDPPKG